MGEAKESVTEPIVRLYEVYTRCVGVVCMLRKKHKVPAAVANDICDVGILSASFISSSQLGADVKQVCFRLK